VAVAVNCFGVLKLTATNCVIIRTYVRTVNHSVSWLEFVLSNSADYHVYDCFGVFDVRSVAEVTPTLRPGPFPGLFLRKVTEPAEINCFGLH